MESAREDGGRQSARFKNCNVYLGSEEGPCCSAPECGLLSSLVVTHHHQADFFCPLATIPHPQNSSEMRRDEIPASGSNSLLLSVLHLYCLLVSSSRTP